MSDRRGRGILGEVSSMMKSVTIGTVACACCVSAALAGPVALQSAEFLSIKNRSSQVPSIQIEKTDSVFDSELIMSTGVFQGAVGTTVAFEGSNVGPPSSVSSALLPGRTVPTGELWIGVTSDREASPSSGTSWKSASSSGSVNFRQNGLGRLAVSDDSTAVRGGLFRGDFAAASASLSNVAPLGSSVFGSDQEIAESLSGLSLQRPPSSPSGASRTGPARLDFDDNGFVPASVPLPAGAWAGLAVLGLLAGHGAMRSRKSRN